MKHGWSIGTRIAVTFAGAAMTLVAGALVFVNLASQWALRSGGAYPVEAEAEAEAGAGTPAIELDPTLPAPDSSVAFVTVVAEQQWQWSAIGVVGAGLLAGVLGWVLSRRVLEPVDRITSATQRISASTLHERIALEGPDDELRRLSHTIDALLDRLEKAFASQRRFVAQASHELRTPLAVQRAALQVGLQDTATPEEIHAARAELLQQNRRTEHLVESLLVLAEAERGLEDRSTVVDVTAVVADVVAQTEEPARQAGVRIVLDGGSAPRDVSGEPLLVRQMLLNLVDNAVEYNRPGGTVWIRTGPDGVTVENTGEVLDPIDVAGLQEPFRRGARPGTKRHSGLGLSIVRAIADAHGWVLRLEPRATGGLRATVRVSSEQLRAPLG